ncbi:MAG: hypothetical protein ACYC24_05060 [Desulfobacteria bacterium]
MGERKSTDRMIHMKGLKGIVILAFLIFSVNETAAAGGLFGPPQPISREAGELHTGIGYGYHEDRYRNEMDHTIRQNQVYSELGYGAKNLGIYGRIGVSDLEILDAFRSTQAPTTTSKKDFKDDRKFFGTLGGQGFYPINATFGIGAFLQGSYYFQDFADDISGTRDGARFTQELKVKNSWDVNFGIGFQAAVPHDIKLYVGPFLYCSRARISPSVNIPGLPSSAGEVTIRNKSNIGGFSGIDVPLARGFRLVVEGRYSERFSVGTAVTYSY